MLTQNKRLLGIILLVPALLLIPFFAMQFTNEVNWDSTDFFVMGTLLLVTGLACEFVLRKVKTFERRLIVVGVVLFAFFLIWAELAVGIFGSPLAGS